MSAPGQEPAGGADTSYERHSGAFGKASAAAPPPSLMTRLRAVLGAPLRDPNPILLKELRATFRTALFVRFLYLSTGLVGLLVLSGGAAIAADNMAPADVGRAVFQIFFSAMSFVLTLVAPAYAATAMTAEKETRTYESLLLSGMGAWRIVIGKFVAYFASMFLVVVAIAPVIGVAFLFGGVSPIAVGMGFFWMVLVLATSVALGIAISARVDSTRVAIVLATVIWVPIAMMASMFVTAMGDAAHSAWSTPFDGPFWFAEAFAQRIDSWDGWAMLVLLPIYGFGMPTWFFLASAVAGVRPSSEDRSTPLKVWAIAASIGALVALAIVLANISTPRDVGEASIALAFAVGVLVGWHALVFADEPPLPPRWQGRPSTLRRVLAVIGPGASGTLRFVFLLIALTALGAALVSSAILFVRFPSYGDFFSVAAAQVQMALGHTALGCFCAALAAWLRSMLRNGVAARVLVLAFVAGASMFPVLGLLLLDPGSLDHLDRGVPFLLLLSPAGPLVGAIQQVEEHLPPIDAAASLVAAGIWSGLACALWIAVEMRVLTAKRWADDRQKRIEHRAALRAQAAAAAAGPSPSPSPSPSPTPTPTPSPSPTPKADPTPSPTPDALPADATDPDSEAGTP